MSTLYRNLSRFLRMVIFFALIPCSIGMCEEALSNAGLMTLRGVSHIHTIYSHDSNANLNDVFTAMSHDDLDFAMITDHNSIKGKTTYKATHEEGDPVLLFANEISTGNGHLIALGVSEMPDESLSTQELIDWIHEKKGYAILAHPLSPKEPWDNEGIENWDGFEVYNFGHELYNQDLISFGLNLQGGDENEVLKSVQRLSPENIDLWDHLLGKRKVTAVVGSNVHLKRDLKYFRTALKSAILYALVPDRSEQALTDAIGQGKSYMVFETYGRVNRFIFTAKQKEKTYRLGETVPSLSDVTLHVECDEAVKIKLIHQGKIVKEENAAELNYVPTESGAYRVEVYKNDILWIFSNAIYITNQSVA